MIINDSLAGTILAGLYLRPRTIDIGDTNTFGLVFSKPSSMCQEKDKIFVDLSNGLLHLHFVL